MMNDVKSTTGNLVIVTTYKLILVTVLQSGKIGLLVGVHRQIVSSKITQLPEKYFLDWQALWCYKFFSYKLSGLWNLFISIALKIFIFVNDE